MAARFGRPRNGGRERRGRGTGRRRGQSTQRPTRRTRSKLGLSYRLPARIAVRRAGLSGRPPGLSGWAGGPRIVMKTQQCGGPSACGLTPDPAVLAWRLVPLCDHIRNRATAAGNWTDNGTVKSTSPNYNFTLATNRNLVANFTVNPVTYTVATQINPANAGSVTGGGTFVAGSSVTVTATANSGYTFTNWTQNGTMQSSSPNYNFILATNRNLVANFTAKPVTY